MIINRYNWELQIRKMNILVALFLSQANAVPLITDTNTVKSMETQVINTGSSGVVTFTDLTPGSEFTVDSVIVSGEEKSGVLTSVLYTLGQKIFSDGTLSAISKISSLLWRQTP